jgi:tetratricopeptide (TPR) repeat protein
MTVTQSALAERASDERLKRLLSYVAADPRNETLKSEAAEQALNVGEPQIASELLADDGGQNSDRELNLLGVAQMQLREFDRATETFERLITGGAGDPAVRFNLAWSLAMSRRFDRAIGLLTTDVTSVIPQAAMLHVQLLHELAEFEAAAEIARTYINLHPGHEGLAAAVSVLALDVEDTDLARVSAERAANHPDALTTLGTLALGEQHAQEAVELFDRALEQNGRSPRAWIGRGLAHLMTNEAESATSDIDRGAKLFGDHIGSWIAAGWAWLIAGKLAPARDRFERAMAIDENFAESHGSLAVVDVLQGEEALARRRIDIAMRLDRQCFSGTFAQTLLTARAGHPEAAQAIFRKILETPVNARGDTAAQALARMGLR